MEADKAGIDCPLGWPDEFVSFMSAHRAGGRAGWTSPLTSPAGTAAGPRASTGPASTATLGQLVDAVLGAAPWLDLGSHEGVCRRSDHAIDAVIAALAARAAALGLATRPAVEQAEAARTEGWIALPTSSLGALKPSR